MGRWKRGLEDAFSFLISLTIPTILPSSLKEKEGHLIIPSNDLSSI